MVADEILPGELHHDGEEGWDGAQSKHLKDKGGNNSYNVIFKIRLKLKVIINLRRDPRMNWLF